MVGVGVGVGMGVGVGVDGTGVKAGAVGVGDEVCELTSKGLNLVTINSTTNTVSVIPIK